MMLIKTRRFQLSRRGAVLLLFGVAWMLLGFSYLHIPPVVQPLLNQQLHAALSVAPIGAYAGGWLACGAVAAVGGAVHRLDGIGFTAAVFMPAVWSVAYWIAAAQGVPRSWVSGLLFTVVACALAVVAGMADPLDRTPRPK